MRFLRREVLQEVRHQDAVEVVVGQLAATGVAHDPPNVGAPPLRLMVDDVDRPPLGRRDGADELPPAGRRVEHARGAGQRAVQPRGDLVPHGLARALLHVLEPELVEALVVDSRAGCVRVWVGHGDSCPSLGAASDRHTESRRHRRGRLQCGVPGGDELLDVLGAA